MCACFIRTSNTNNFNVVSHHCHTFPPCWPALAGHRSWHKVWKWWWNSVEFVFFLAFLLKALIQVSFFFWMTIMYSICLYTSIDLCTRLFYFADVSPGWHQKPPLVHYGMQCSDGPESSGRDGLVVGWYCREALQCRLMWRSLTFCHDKKHLCIVNVRKPPFCYLLATEGCPSVWLIPHHGTLVLVMSHLQTIIFSWQMGKMATSYNGLKCNIFLCLFHYPSSNVKILCLCQLRTQHVATNMLDF